MTRILYLAYATTSYAIFFVTFAYLIGFLADFAVPRSVDSGPNSPLALALAVDLGLLSLFALQHSLMARRGFKRWWARIVPAPIERSTYVLLSSAVLLLLFWQWRPIPGLVWEADGTAGWLVLQGFFAAGIALVFYSTLLIDHLDLFGLRQVILHWKNLPIRDDRFVVPSLYRWVRHPLYVGWFVVFWATPRMTWGHALFALANTLYIVIAVHFEERDLETRFGADYARYREHTPRYVPRLRRPLPSPPLTRLRRPLPSPRPTPLQR